MSIPTYPQPKIAGYAEIKSSIHRKFAEIIFPIHRIYAEIIHPICRNLCGD
jgi:hypothetical protein